MLPSFCLNCVRVLCFFFTPNFLFLTCHSYCFNVLPCFSSPSPSCGWSRFDLVSGSLE
jgi:hypothetical protein